MKYHTHLIECLPITEPRVRVLGGRVLYPIGQSVAVPIIAFMLIALIMFPGPTSRA